MSNINYIHNCPKAILMECFSYGTYNQLITGIKCINKLWKLLVNGIIHNNTTNNNNNYFIDFSHINFKSFNRATFSEQYYAVKRVKIYNNTTNYKLNQLLYCIDGFLPNIKSLIWIMDSYEPLTEKCYGCLTEDRHLTNLTIHIPHLLNRTIVTRRDFSTLDIIPHHFLFALTESLEIINFLSISGGIELKLKITTKLFFDNLIQICPNLTSLILVDPYTYWDFVQLSKLKQLKTLGIFYNEEEWNINTILSNRIIPERLYYQIEQHNNFQQLSNFIIYMAAIPANFIYNPQTTITIKKQNNNSNNHNDIIIDSDSSDQSIESTDEQIINIVFKLLYKNEVKDVLKVVIS